MIVDASVALKWVIEEPGSDAALELLETEPLAAPDLMGLEVRNALLSRVRRGLSTPAEARSAEDAFSAVSIEFAPSLPLARAAFDLALALEHPVYDCIYLALAMERDAALVTADRRLLQAVSRRRELQEHVRPLS